MRWLWCAGLILFAGLEGLDPVCSFPSQNDCDGHRSVEVRRLQIFLRLKKLPQRRPIHAFGMVLMDGVAGFIAEHARDAFKK